MREFEHWVSIVLVLGGDKIVTMHYEELGKGKV